MPDFFPPKKLTETVAPSAKGGQTFYLKLWNFVVNKFIDSRCWFHLNYPVRVHSQIVFASLSQPCGSWMRLWYFCRGMDRDGRGLGGFRVSTILEIFDIKLSTFYQWLRDGKKFGAFRDWRIRAGELQFVLGGLKAVSLALNLEAWGTAGDLPLESAIGLKQFRSEGASIQVKRSQQASYNAARRSIHDKKHRSHLVRPQTLIELWANSHPHTETGHGVKGPLAPYVLHVSRKKIFVSHGFIPYGASQEGISDELGISDRSIRRYVEFLKIPRRQLIQAKTDYKFIANCLEHNVAPEYGDTNPRVRLMVSKGRGFYLSEKNGYASVRGTYEVDQKRFFAIEKIDPESRWKFREKVWINRCNIYSIDTPLRTMRASIRQFKRLKKLMHCSSRPAN